MITQNRLRIIQAEEDKQKLLSKLKGLSALLNDLLDKQHCATNPICSEGERLRREIEANFLFNETINAVINELDNLVDDLITKEEEV